MSSEDVVCVCGVLGLYRKKSWAGKEGGMLAGLSGSRHAVVGEYCHKRARACDAKCLHLNRIYR